MGEDELVHEERLSPNYDERTLPISMVVLHYTEMKPVGTAIERLTDPAAKVSAHYLITEEGGVIRLVPEDRRAWHAGLHVVEVPIGFVEREAGASKMSMMFRSKADDDCSSSTAKLAAESLREGIDEGEGGVGRGGVLKEAGRRCERAERSG